MNKELLQNRKVREERATAIKELTHVPSLAASGTNILGEFDCANLRTLSVGLKCTYDASATGSVRLAVYHKVGNNELDTVPYAYFDVDVSAGNTVKETHNFDLPEDGDIVIKAENQDASYGATDVHAWAIIRRWS